MPPSLVTSDQTSVPMYYVKNFNVVLDTVAELYQNLLTDQEQSFLKSCRTMPRPALRLFLRLHARVGNYFRSDKLQYNEIPHLMQAAEVLADHGLLVINCKRQPTKLLQLLLKSELLKLLRDQDSVANLSSNMLKNQLTIQAQALPEEVITHFCSKHFSWFQLLPCYIIDLFKLLFFGNWYQDLTEFIQTDLGIKKYEQIKLGLSQRFLPDRSHIENALRYRHIQKYIERPQVDWDVDAMEKLLKHLPETFNHPFLERRKGKTCNAVGYFLEKSGRQISAMEAYSLTEMPPARERFIRLQISRGDWESALVQTILLSRTAVDDSEMQYALRAKRQIQNALKLCPDNISTRRWSEYQIFIDQQPGESVEQATIRALAEEGREAFFAENRFWLNLLGLTFWDIIFTEIPGVFLNPFQRGPIDLWYPDFAQRRSKAIDKRLNDISDGETWIKHIQTIYAIKAPIQNSLVVWSTVNWTHIQRVQKAMTQEAMVKIFERMIKNLKYYRVGLPDLIVFNNGRAQLLEVKSRNDRLSPHQIGWLNFLLQNRIDCAVARALPKQDGNS